MPADRPDAIRIHRPPSTSDRIRFSKGPSPLAPSLSEERRGAGIFETLSHGVTPAELSDKILHMEMLVHIASESWNFFREASIYLLLGFFVAGIIRVYLTPDSIAHYFRRGRFGSVLYASLFGIPVPL